MLSKKFVKNFFEEYVNEKDVISFGTSIQSLELVKDLALKNILDDFKVSLVPTSVDIARIADEFNVPLSNFDSNINLCLEFANSFDRFNNFVKLDSTSLIRDKMISYYADKTYVICFSDVIDKLNNFPIEISRFGVNKTLMSLECFGRVSFSNKKSLEQNFICNLELDTICNYDDIDYSVKRIPGVLETGLFLGMADKIFYVKKS